ncbi:hypothetical protein AB1283_01285 [Bacillus sp. S13(2024)]|uniref:hypothetical protein n=1 Tax=unclassified Bacillus (in: firmicutes) TaxID=185979 RepID=UPI003D18FE3F
MKFTKHETQEQFDQLQKGDVVIVKWREGVKQFKELGEITHHNVCEINRLNELILNKRRNDFFSIRHYLKYTSYAEEVYVVTQ